MKSLVVFVQPCPASVAATVGQALEADVVSVPDLAGLTMLFGSAPQYDLMFVAVDASTPIADVATVLEEAAARCPAISLGFLYGRGPQQLHDAADRFASSHLHQQPIESVQLALVDRTFMSCAMGARLHTVDAQSIPIVGRPATGPHADVLFLVGHANGQHAVFADTALCCHRDSRSSTSNQYTFPCYHGAECALRTEAFRQIPIDLIAAHAVVAAICWGASFGGALFAPELSLGDGMLRFGSVRTLLTLIRASPLSQVDVLFIYYHCNLGLAFGRIANAVNRHRLLRGDTPDFICLGDPRYCIRPTVVHVASRRSDSSHIAELPASHLPVDVRVSAPTASIPEKPVIVVEDGDVVAALVTSDGDVMFTVPPSAAVRHVKFRIASVSEVESRIRTYGHMITEINYFREFVMLVARSTDGVCREVPGAAVMQLAERCSNIEYEIRRRGAGPIAGMMVRLSELDAMASTIEAGQVAVADAWLLVAEHLMSDGAIYLAFIMDAHVRMSNAGRKGKCLHCGSGTTTYRRAAMAGGAACERVMCDRCGLVYEGDGRSCGWLTGSHVLTAGEEVRMTVDVFNGEGHDMGARLVLRMGLFRQAADIVCRSAMTPVRPDATATLSCLVRVPKECKPGLYFINAAVMVGLRPTILRKAVLVTALSAAER